MIRRASTQRAVRTQASWQELYQAALFESDRSRVAGRIADAERAILERVHELSAVEIDHIEEDELLDDVLYALRALRNCVGLKTRTAA